MTTISTPQSYSLDNFLRAEVEIQPNGTSLTVLSMLARLGLDPWEEAESLSVLPNEVAVSWLAAAIGRCSPHFGEQRELSALASRLIDRLPAQNPVLQSGPIIPNDLASMPIWKSMIVCYAVIGIFLIIARGFG